MAERKWLRLIWPIALALAVAAIVFGTLRGEADTVLVKAINLCFECIGLG